MPRGPNNLFPFALSAPVPRVDPRPGSAGPNASASAHRLHGADAGVVAAPDPFDAFSCNQYPALLRFMRSRLPTEEDAHDAAQESFTRLLRYRESEPAEAWRPLLYRIAVNVVGEQFRRGSSHRLKQHVPLEGLELPSQAPEQEELIERRQRKALLREAILALSPRSRQVYLLSRVDGLTYPQIAKRCGISVKAVEKSISRTMATLAQHVGAGGSRAS